MSVRFDAVGDTLDRTASLPSHTAFTICGWSRIISDTGAGLIQPLFIAADGGNTDAVELLWNNSFGAMSLWVADGGSIIASVDFASRPAAGTDFFWYQKCSGTGANLLQGGWRAAGSNTWVRANLTLGTTIAAPATYYLGGVIATYYANHRKWNVKCWDRALSDAELHWESEFLPVISPQNLNFWYPLDRADVIRDYGPNRRDPTLGGTLTTEATPVALRTRRRPRRVLAKLGVAINATQQALALAAQAAQIRLSRNVSATSAALSLSAQPAVVNRGLVMPAGTQALSLATSAAAVRLGRNVAASAQALSLSAQASTVKLSKAVAAAVQGLTLTPRTATMKLSRAVAAAVQALTLTGNPAQVGGGKVISAGTVALALATLSSTVNRGNRVAAAQALLALTAQPQAVKLSRAVQAGSVSLSITTQAGAVRVSRAVLAGLASLSLTELDALAEGEGAAVTISAGRIIRVASRDGRVVVPARERRVRARNRNSTIH